MSAADYLKSVRDDNYNPSKPPKSEGKDDAGGGDNDPDEPNRTSRIIKLSDDEQKSLQPYAIKPGEEVILEVHGNLEEDGHFHVMSVNYAEGKGSGPKEGSEMDMANKVAMLVKPQLQISPS